MTSSATAAVTDKIKTFKDLQSRCNLYQTQDDSFFSEWREDLPELADAEKAGIAKIKQRHDMISLPHFPCCRAAMS